MPQLNVQQFKYKILQQKVENQMKLYCPEQNYKQNKIQLASKIYKKTVNVEKVQFDPKVSKPFKDSYPQYTLPLLQTEEGKFISGVNSILMYIAGETEFKNRIQKAKIFQQLQRLQRDVQAATGVMILKSKGFTEITQAQVEKSKDIITKYIKQLNEKLSIKTFLTGDRLTIADISVYYNLKAVRQQPLQKQIQKYKNVLRWMSHIQSLDQH